MTPALERRTLRGVDVRAEQPTEATPGGVLTLSGHAALFNSRSVDLGPFVEVLAPGAFAKVLASGPDVVANINHEEWPILGRTTAGTLRLSEDSAGLVFEVTPPDIEATAELTTAIERGELGGMSFCFRTGVEEWDTTGPVPLRTIVEVAELRDVSFVTWPAYPEAGADVYAAMRSLDAWRKRADRMDAKARARRRFFEVLSK